MLVPVVSSPNQGARLLLLPTTCTVANATDDSNHSWFSTYVSKPPSEGLAHGQLAAAAQRQPRDREEHRAQARPGARADRRRRCWRGGSRSTRCRPACRSSGSLNMREVAEDRLEVAGVAAGAAVLDVADVDDLRDARGGVDDGDQVGEVDDLGGAVGRVADDGDVDGRRRRRDPRRILEVDADRDAAVADQMNSACATPIGLTWTLTGASIT